MFLTFQTGAVCSGDSFIRNIYKVKELLIHMAEGTFWKAQMGDVLAEQEYHHGGGNVRQNILCDASNQVSELGL